MTSFVLCCTGVAKEQVHLSMVERVQLAKRIVAAREKPKPDTWPVICKREGVPSSTARRIYAEVVERRQKLNDPTGQSVLGETLALFEEGLEELAALMADPETPPSTRVAAWGKILETTDRRFHLLLVSGRMPRNLVAANDREQANLIVRRIIDVLARHQVSTEILDELIELVEDKERMALPAAM